MKQHKLEITYCEYESASELSAEDAALVTRAREMTHNSYAPYSHFNVGAAIRTSSGNIYGGANQENAAFPSGMCAERSALYYTAAAEPDSAIEAIAIAASYNGEPTQGIVTPCGACRQALVQYEEKSGKPIRVILCAADRFLVLSNIKSLLPFVFDII